MFQTFRQTMTWLHTWFGLVLGFVLMVAFFFGALSVFDREFDRWSMPSTRFAAQPMPSFDRVLRPAFERITGPDPEELATVAERVNGPLPAQLPLMDWSAFTTHRDPVLDLYASFDLPNAKDPDDHTHGHRTIDPRDGRELPAGDLKIGSEFFYPLHYGLHIAWFDLGIWIVGLASLAMLAALVSGVVIHRKLFRELFTFRPRAQRQRAVLDLHNLTGVVALPFHFFFALTGLIIFAEIYFPVSTTTLRPIAEAHEAAEAVNTGLPAEPAGVAAPLASVDAMVADAQRRWHERGMGGEVGYLFVNHPGDANGYVSIYRAGTDQVALTSLGIHYRADTGALIREDPDTGAVEDTLSFLSGLHLQQFRHWPLRFLYLFGGLAGCVCIATGFLFFVAKRRQLHARNGRTGLRWVDTFAITAVTGMVIATLAMLAGNRLLPGNLAGRADWQARLFWFAWLATLAHAFWRAGNDGRQPVRAWHEQCVAIAVLAVAAPLLNAWTTGGHLPAMVAAGYWPVAGVDIALLLVALTASLVSRKLRQVVRVPLSPAATETT